VDHNRQANKSPAKARESHGTSQSTRADNQSASGAATPANQKIMITGDDILIEYVTRLMKMFSTNKIREENLSTDQQ